MKRVVVTGMGLVSCLGNSLDEAEAALREARSGIRFVEDYAQLGLRSHVAGVPDLSGEPPVDRKLRRFMGDAAAYAYHALRKAIDDAGLAPAQVSRPRTGLIVGSGVGSPLHHVEAMDILRNKGIHKVLPYTVPRVMGSTASAALAVAFGIQGHSYGITSACASSAHCIGHAMELIQLGKQDIVFAGGAEEVVWTSTAPFDAMGALSTSRNATPAAASRPYDSGRDGFVIAGGGGMLVLEDYEHARARGARIHAELCGYGASSDGEDMVTPTAEGAARAMAQALDQAGMASVDYINSHATSTRLGDITELEAIRRVFGDRLPLISSTKGLTGHAIAASGVQEAIYSLLMMDRGFVAACANLEEVDPAAAEFPLVRRCEARRIDSFLSNSFGFGGTNASLLFRRCPD